MGILASAMLPLAFSIVQEQRAVRSYYFHAIAMEIVDGEIETLAAGRWRSFPRGAQTYPVRAECAKNLPPGSFRLSIEEQTIRLEWHPQKAGQGGSVSRSAGISRTAEPAR